MLPVEIRCIILEYLEDSIDIASCALLCKDWYAAVKYFGRKIVQEFSRNYMSVSYKLLSFEGYGNGFTPYASEDDHAIKSMLKLYNKQLGKLRFGSDYDNLIKKTINKIKRKLCDDIRSTWKLDDDIPLTVRMKRHHIIIKIGSNKPNKIKLGRNVITTADTMLSYTYRMESQMVSNILNNIKIRVNCREFRIGSYNIYNKYRANNISGY